MIRLIFTGELHFATRALPHGVSYFTIGNSNPEKCKGPVRCTFLLYSLCELKNHPDFIILFNYIAKKKNQGGMVKLVKRVMLEMHRNLRVEHYKALNIGILPYAILEQS